MNGEVFYNCSVNTTENNDLGCYHGDGQSHWVKCQQPHGMCVVKCVMFVTAESRRQRRSALGSGQVMLSADIVQCSRTGLNGNSFVVNFVRPRTFIKCELVHKKYVSGDKFRMFCCLFI